MKVNADDEYHEEIHRDEPIDVKIDAGFGTGNKEEDEIPKTISADVESGYESQAA